MKCKLQINSVILSALILCLGCRSGQEIRQEPQVAFYNLGYGQGVVQDWKTSNYDIPAGGGVLRFCLEKCDAAQHPLLYSLLSVYVYTGGNGYQRRAEGGMERNFDESHEVHLAPQAADGGEPTKMAGDWYSVQVDTATMECVCRFSPNRTGKQRTIRLLHSVAGKFRGIVNNHYIYELRQQ